MQKLIEDNFLLGISIPGWFVIFGCFGGLTLFLWLEERWRRKTVQKRIKNCLDENVAKGTLSQEQADALQWALLERKNSST